MGKLRYLHEAGKKTFLPIYMVLQVVIVARLSYSATFYVAPPELKGNDGNAGTNISSPFATPYRAQAAIRELRRTGLLAEDVIVYFRSGRYELAMPLRFEAIDGGTQSHSIRYSAYPLDKPPIFQGGRTITGWVKTAPNTWVVTIPDVKVGESWFTQLFEDDKRLTRSRFPNEGHYLFAVEGTDAKEAKIIRCAKESIPFKNLGGTSTEAVVFHDWDISRQLIDSSDHDGIYLYPNDLFHRKRFGVKFVNELMPKPGTIFYLENVPENPKTPGTWYLDRQNGQLTFIGRQDENPEDHEFVIPVLSQLLLVKGSDSGVVTNLHFDGLSFSYSNWTIRDDLGYCGGQACNSYDDNRNSPKCLVVPAAITLAYAENCSFSRVCVSHIGQCAIALGQKTRNCAFSHCEISDIGCSGIVIGWRGFLHPDGMITSMAEDWGDNNMAPSHCKIDSCSLQGCGKVLFGSVGIHVLFAKSTILNGNDISDVSHSGILMGFSWGVAPTTIESTFVQNNFVHNVVNRLADGGAIGTLGNQGHATLSQNTISDVNGCSLTSATASSGAFIEGFFFDNGSCDIRVLGNNVSNCRDFLYRYNLAGTSPALRDRIFVSDESKRQ